MYSNIYGVDGVTKAIQIMKEEILSDAAQAGITDLRNVSSKIVSLTESIVKCLADQSKLNTRALEDEVYLLD